MKIFCDFKRLNQIAVLDIHKLTNTYVILVECDL